MSRVAKQLAMALFILALPTYAADRPTTSGHYLFAWAGDVSHKDNDFLAVIDADPASASYGHLMATAVTDQVSKQVHHTEYVMPEGGFLFANDHLAGRTFVFDVRDPLHVQRCTRSRSWYMYSPAPCAGCRPSLATTSFKATASRMA